MYTTRNAFFSAVLVVCLTASQVHAQPADCDRISVNSGYWTTSTNWECWSTNASDWLPCDDEDFEGLDCENDPVPDDSRS